MSNGFHLIRYLYTSLLAFAFLGCAGSWVQNVSYTLQPHHQISLCILPFEKSGETYVAGDWKANWHWKLTKGDTIKILQGNNIISPVAPTNDNIYVYYFDKKDFQNLKQSLLNCLTKSKSFKNVNYQETPLTYGDNRDTYFIQLYFGPSGIKQTALVSTCILNADFSILSSNHEVLMKNNIGIDKMSIFCVLDAKNKAIKTFVKEVMALIDGYKF